MNDVMLSLMPWQYLSEEFNISKKLDKYEKI